MVLQRMQFEVGQLTVLSSGRSGELVELQQVFPPRYAQSWQIPKCRCAPLAATVVSTWWRASCIAASPSKSTEPPYGRGSREAPPIPISRVIQRMLADVGWACSHTVQTVVAHIKDLLSRKPPIVQC